MKKEKLQADIQYYTGKLVSLDEITDNKINEAQKFLDKVCQEYEKVSNVDKYISLVQYELYRYYQENYNM